MLQFRDIGCLIHWMCQGTYLFRFLLRNNVISPQLFRPCEAQPFHDGSPYFKKTSLLICSANQWTGSYMTGTPVMKELIH